MMREIPINKAHIENTIPSVRFMLNATIDNVAKTVACTLGIENPDSFISGMKFPVTNGRGIWKIIFIIFEIIQADKPAPPKIKAFRNNGFILNKTKRIITANKMYIRIFEIKRASPAIIGFCENEKKKLNKILFMRFIILCY